MKGDLFVHYLSSERDTMHSTYVHYFFIHWHIYLRSYFK